MAGDGIWIAKFELSTWSVRLLCSPIRTVKFLRNKEYRT